VRRVRKFFSLAPAERRLLLRALSRLTRTCLKLHVLPPGKWHAMLASRATKLSRQRYSEEQIAWAVRAAARYVPTANCLPQAIVGKQLLEEQGFAPVLRLGVQDPGELGLKAHAWVETGGRTVVGADGQDYHTLKATAR
jgi:hypothetical protein